MAIPLLGPILTGLATAGKWLLSNAPMIVSVAQSVKSLFSGADKKALSEVPEFDDSKASLEDRMHISALLSRIKNNALERAQDLEEQFIQASEDGVLRLVEFLEDHDIVPKSLERVINSNSRQIHGALKSVITSSLSLDNSKCLEILKLSEGSTKEARMSEFIDEILASGLRKIGNEISTNTQSAFEHIKEILHSKLESEEQILQNSLKDLQEFQSSHKLGEKQAQEIKMLDELWGQNYALKFLAARA